GCPRPTSRNSFVGTLPGSFCRPSLPIHRALQSSRRALAARLPLGSRFLGWQELHCVPPLPVSTGREGSGVPRPGLVESTRTSYLPRHTSTRRRSSTGSAATWLPACSTADLTPATWSRAGIKLVRSATGRTSMPCPETCWESRRDQRRLG